MSPLTPPQDHVLALISAGATISAATQSAGVHRNTVHNWINSQPHFRAALACARESKAMFWQDEAEQLAATAVDTIRALMTGASTPAAIRLKAAQSILQLAMAPPAQQEFPSLLDLLPSQIADGHTASESFELPVGAAQPAASGVSPLARPTPKTVHNSAQSTAEPPPRQTAPSPPECPVVRVPASSSKVGRNRSCPCGSGKKFKRCCLNRQPPGGLAAAA